MTFALLRCLAADAIRAQRWAAPVLVFLMAVVVLSAAPGPALPVYAATSTVLLPCALWLTVVVLNSEDPAQAAVTTGTAGGLLRVRLAGLVVAGLIGLPLALAGTAWPVITSHWGRDIVLAGLAAHLLTLLAGLAFGSVLSRPVLSRRAWAVMAGACFCLAEIVIPGAPPARQIISAFTVAPGGSHGLAGPLALAAAETLAMSAALIGAGYALARSRA